MDIKIGSLLWVSPNRDDEWTEGTVTVIIPDEWGDRYAVALEDGRVFVRDDMSTYTERPRIW